MGNIINDIVDEIQIKPNKMKLVLKWIISLAITSIVAAFTYGQVKSARANRLSTFENQLILNTDAMIELKNEMKSEFNAINIRIDKIYDDGYNTFYDYQIFNNKQLGLIIDYSNTNKDMLKRMLELSSMERTKQIEMDIEQAKTEPPKPIIIVKQKNNVDTIK